MERETDIIPEKGLASIIGSTTFLKTTKFVLQSAIAITFFNQAAHESVDFADYIHKYGPQIRDAISSFGYWPIRVGVPLVAVLGNALIAYIAIKGIGALFDEPPESSFSGIKFDHAMARKVREREGLNQAQLGSQLGYERKSYAQKKISEYETGHQIPNPNSPSDVKYLVWLRDQGYNPFDLQSNL